MVTNDKIYNSQTKQDIELNQKQLKKKDCNDGFMIQKSRKNRRNNQIETEPKEENQIEIKKNDELPDEINDFEDMTFLSEALYMGICEYGFKIPSQIQAKTIHIINSGADLIAQSQSGTGKTGAFAIGSLSNINPNYNYPQVILLSNARILACQTAKVVENIALRMNINVCVCIGGQKGNTHNNVQEAKNAHVLVGTPGRIRELICKKIFDGNKIRTLIMDETDVLLKDDFKNQIMDIVKHVGKNTQICVFSATFTKETLEQTENFLRDPYRITVEKEKLSLDCIRQYNVNVKFDKAKLFTLIDLHSQLFISQMIIFVNSIRTANYLRDKLMDVGIEAGLVHGKQNHIDRENILKEFRLSNLKTLITTDVMCRGVDFDDLKLVINYDMAPDAETYIHRVGRSGRYGGQGVAINLCTYDDMHKLKILERVYNIKIEEMPEPDKINEITMGMEPSRNKVQSSKNYMS